MKMIDVHRLVGNIYVCNKKYMLLLNRGHPAFCSKGEKTIPFKSLTFHESKYDKGKNKQNNAGSNHHIEMRIYE